MYPSESNPAFGSFVKELEDSIKKESSARFIKALIRSDKKGLLYTPFKYFVLTLKVIYFSLFKKFDVIYAHYLFPTGLISLIPKYIRKKPLIITSHGSDIKFTRRKGLLKKITEFILKKSDQIITVSNFSKNALIENSGVYQSKIAVINCGVDTNFFVPISKIKARGLLNLPQDKKIILFVGNLVELKGIDILIRAISALNTMDLVLYLIGEGPMEKQLKDLVNTDNLTDRVVFLKFKPKEALPRWYSAADMLILPSRMEAFGLVALEALACGTPVVASNIGGIPEFVHNNRNGFTFEPGDSSDLAEKITKILNLSQSEYEIFSLEARAEAESHSLRIQTLKIVKLFEDQINKNAVA